VRNPGTYKIPNERMTILEAIGLAGDLRMTGNRKNVLVIRDENGKKTEYRIDLTSKELFSSAAYYLTQNDVIYIEPNVTARSESTLWRTAGPIFISLTSLVVTTFTLLFR
jgi:polysaccharide export outer membrane protein